MTETLLVPAWVRMEARPDAVELLHPEFQTVAGAARRGWTVRDVYPLADESRGQRPVVVHLQRDEESIAAGLEMQPR
jgi:hypothetical protein